MFGLSKEIYYKIIEVTRKYNYDFYIFGSRAKNSYRDNSDIDIAVYGDIKEEEEMKIRNDFDILDIPHTIDIVFVNKTTKQELLKSIEVEGVKI